MVFTIIVVELLAMTSGINTTIMAAGANLATTLATSVGFWYLYIYYKTIRKEIAKELIKTKKYKYTRILSTIKEVLTVSIPMSLTSILGSLNKSIDSITVVRGLKNFLSENEAKIQYGILSGKVDTLVMLPMSFNVALTTSLIPTIAYSKAMGDSETIKKEYHFNFTNNINGTAMHGGTDILWRTNFKITFSKPKQWCDCITNKCNFNYIYSFRTNN